MEGGGVGIGDIRCATLIRDAVAFALFAMFGYRISVLTSLELDEHVRLGENGDILMCIRKESTKPGIRDLVHEVPRELIPLIKYYLNDARRVLLKGRSEHQRLFVSSHDGAPLGKAAIYAMFVTRTADILGEVHNPHQVRKAWASDWARWTKGDYMTASSILDNSPLTLQKSYVKNIREEQIADFDEATRDAWTGAEGGAA
jgi:integrase